MKRDDLPFRYFIAGISEALTENSDMWDHPFVEALPNRSTGPSGRAKHDAADLKLHEYFNAAETFITSALLGRFEEGATRQNIAPSTQKTEKGLPPFEQIRQVDIFLEKHGVFYHPARVEVTLKYEYDSHIRPPDTTKPESLGNNNGHVRPPDTTKNERSRTADRELFHAKNKDFNTKRHFVLNTAISPQGLALIHQEYTLLKQLGTPSQHHHGIGQRLIPRVFGAASYFCRGMEISFFLGEWFDGFHEFHLTDSTHPDSGNETLHLWKSDGRVVAYSPPHYFPIYGKASEILTTFYNPTSFAHIFPWHHAAGDFVVKPTPDGFDVRLITVRGYAPILAFETDSHDMDPVEYMDPLNAESDANEQANKSGNPHVPEAPEVDPEDIDKALLIFFLTLSLRMRIDRKDGIGAYCLLHPDALDHILKGFFKALHPKTTQTYREPGDLKNAFGTYLQQFNPDHLHQILEMITNSGHAETPENKFIKANLGSHAKILSHKIQGAGKNGFFIDKAS